jgi:hypothetical protein
MLTILFIVGRTTLFTPVDINLQQVVDFLNFYACIVFRSADFSYLMHVLTLACISKAWFTLIVNIGDAHCRWSLMHKMFCAFSSSLLTDNGS